MTGPPSPSLSQTTTHNETTSETGSHPVPLDEKEAPPNRSSSEKHTARPPPLQLVEPTPFPPIDRAITTASTRPYSAFSPATKYLVVVLSAISGILSPISSNIYVPAIPTLAIVFNTTNTKITLGVTVFLVFQAITPSIFGAASDTYGRRPIYVVTLLVYLAADIGLACCPTSAYWLLLVLRALQATGGSAVIAIGAGAISDIAEPKERGKYFAIFQAGAMTGPALGPTIGALLNSGLGWRSIFWFLAILTGVVLVPLIFFYPETLRSLVGDGSIPPPALNCSPTMLFQRRKMKRAAKKMGEEGEHVERPPRKKVTPDEQGLSAAADDRDRLVSTLVGFHDPLQARDHPGLPLRLATVSRILLHLSGLFHSVVGQVPSLFSADRSVLSVRLDLSLFPLSVDGGTLRPSGLGTICTSLLNGRQIDYFYRKETERVGGDFKKKPDEFRIEYTRLRCLFPFMTCFLCASIALGWCLETQAPLAVTLVVNFFVGLGTGTINTATVYGQDVVVGKGGAVSASLNLVRCIFGAIGTACIQQMYSSIGPGWSMVLLSGICLAGTPLLWVVITQAPKWRKQRAEKERLRAASQMA
ncbi:hypothetical protein P7C73_g3346, partial [Tremellales sp. Uapishka_1]